MNTLVTGSRSIESPLIVADILNRCPWDIEHIIHGNADGVDSMASRYATRNRLTQTAHPIPNWVWEQVGPSAGPMRNEYMVTQADRVVAIWDGESSGTKDSINQATAEGLPIYKVVCERTQKDGDMFWTIDRTKEIPGDQASLADFEQ